MRVSIYLVWAGLVVAALGILGFILSFDQVAGRTQVANGHRVFPWLAYISIFMWAGGSIIAWGSRTHINRTLRSRQRAVRESISIDIEGED